MDKTNTDKPAKEIYDYLLKYGKDAIFCLDNRDGTKLFAFIKSYDDTHIFLVNNRDPKKQWVVAHKAIAFIAYDRDDGPEFKPLDEEEDD